MIKKVLCILLVLSILPLTFFADANTYNSANLNNLNIGNVMNLGIPGNELQFVECVFSTQNGKNMLYTSNIGNPSYFIAYNLDENKVQSKLILDGAHGNWNYTLDSKGNIYISTGGKLFKYNTATNVLDDIGIINPKDLSTLGQSILTDSSDNIYIGTYPNSSIIKYSPVNKAFSVIKESLLEGQTGLHSIALIGDEMYFGGYASFSNFGKINLKTNIVTYLPALRFTDGNMALKYHSLTAIGDNILSVAQMNNGQNNKMVIFDTKNNVWKIASAFSTNSLTPSCAYDSKYFVSDTDNKFLKAYDINKKAFEDTKIPNISLRGAKVINGLLTTVDITGNIVTLNLNDNSINKVYANILDSMEVKNLISAENNSLFINSGSGLYNYNIISDSTVKHDLVDSDGVIKYNNLYYYVLDGNVISNGNVDYYLINDFKLKGWKVTDIYNAGGKEIAAYKEGENSGIAIYNPLSKQITEINKFEKKTIKGLTYFKGKIYGIFASENGTDGQVFKIDVEKQAIEADIALNSHKLFGIINNDNGVYLSTDKSIISLNPDNLSVVKEISIPTLTNGNNGNNLSWASNNLLFAQINKEMFLVDVVTNEFRKIHDKDVTFSTLGSDGYVYFISNDKFTLNRLPISINDKNLVLNFSGDSEEDKRLLGKSIILKINKPYSYLNLVSRPIDALNSNVMPFIENDRTLVPLRFISESFGADVNWNEGTQTVTISYLTYEIAFKIGDNQILYNDEYIPLDVSAKIVNNRTFVPLRAIGEAFGKNVFWDDRQIIIINNKYVPDKIKDAKKLDAIVNSFN